MVEEGKLLRSYMGTYLEAGFSKMCSRVSREIGLDEVDRFSQDEVSLGGIME